MGDDCARTNLRGGSPDAVHEDIVMVGIVVEQDQGLDVRRIGQSDPLLPGRVSPAFVRRELLVGVRRVVDHDVGALNQAQDAAVEPPDLVFSIGDIGHHAAVVFHPIAGRSIWVI